MLIFMSIAGCRDGDAPESPESPEPRSSCSEVYADPEDFGAFPDGTVGEESVFGFGLYCLAAEGPAEWCRAHLPCWEDKPECPGFERFLELVGFTDADSTYTFSTNYDFSAVFDCTVDGYQIFHYKRPEAGAIRVYFDAASSRVSSIWVMGPDDVHVCGEETVSSVWWGEPIYEDFECEKRYRSEFLGLEVADTAEPAPLAPGREGGGCSSVVPSSAPAGAFCVLLLDVARRRRRLASGDRVRRQHTSRSAA